MTIDKQYLLINFEIDSSKMDEHPYAYSIMENHFKTMQLAKRYQNLVVNETFKRFREELTDANEDTKLLEWTDVTIEKLKEKIDERLRGLKSHGRNH